MHASQHRGSRTVLRDQAIGQTDSMKAARRSFWNMPLPGRFAVCSGVIGAIVGLVIGLNVYAPTAWFAAIELGVPSTAAGGIVGLIVSAGGTASRRLKR
jgi:hypothetical protein